MVRNVRSETDDHGRPVAYNRGAGPDYLDDQRGHDWAAKTGRAMARNLATVARALVATPTQAPE